MFLSHEFQRQYSKRKELLRPYHTHTLELLAQSVVLWLNKTYTFHKLRTKVQFNGSQKSNADSSRRESLKKIDEQFTPSTAFITLRSVSKFHGYHESAGYANGICSKGESSAYAFWNQVPEKAFQKNWHAANLKPWKDTLVVRYSIKISVSKSQMFLASDAASASLFAVLSRGRFMCHILGRCSSSFMTSVLTFVVYFLLLLIPLEHFGLRPRRDVPSKKGRRPRSSGPLPHHLGGASRFHPFEDWWAFGSSVVGVELT